MAVRCMAIPNFHDAVLAGLVISVGGLTEAVVKSSAAALLDHTKDLRAKDDKRAIGALSHSLLALFAAHRGDDRVIMPLLRTVVLLLEKGVFDGSRDPKNDAFAVRLLECASAEAAQARDMKKMFSTVNLYLGLVEFEEPIRGRSLTLLMSALAHKWPKLRKFTAEQLYTKMLVFDVPGLSEDQVDDALEVLSTTLWDGTLASVVQQRDKLAAGMGIEVVDDAPARAAGEKKVKKDELESYSYLIKTEGY